MPRIAFHPERLKRLPTPARAPSGAVAQVDYWDESQPGFGLRISSSGARTWVLMARVARQGKPVQVRTNVGRYGDPAEIPGALTLADARAKAHALSLSIEAGQDPQAMKQAARATVVEESKSTFGAVVDAFLAKHCSDLRPSTLLQYKSIDVAHHVRYAARPL